jgi:hypothetical protein
MHHLLAVIVHAQTEADVTARHVPFYRHRYIRITSMQMVSFLSPAVIGWITRGA